jgi:hypothetical protein
MIVPTFPTTRRERVQEALHVTGWMLQAIGAPKGIEYWPRRDREAWFDVIGRPKLRQVLHSMLTEQAGAPVAPEGMTIDPEDTLVEDR